MHLIMSIATMNKLQQRRLNTQLEAENMITHHQLDGELAIKILKSILDDYVLNGGERSHVLTLRLKRDIPREIVVNLYNDLNKKDVIKIRAKKTPNKSASESSHK